jgi:DNA polymerase-3 subunit delta
VSKTAPGPLRLILGDEEFLIARAVADTIAAARAADAECDARELVASEIEPGDLYDLLSPSLFAERRVVVIHKAQDARAELVDTLTAYIKDPVDSICLVLVHAGGAKGKALLAAMKAAKAQTAECKKLTRPEERDKFIRSEVARAGGSIGGAAAAALLDAVGNDLRELSAACSQLVSDSGGQIDVEAVARYHRGRAEVSGFAVSDRAVVGDIAGAIETLRWALSIGVAPVLVADALADGVRTIAKVSGAGRGNPYELAGVLGMPAWKIKRAQGQARGWTEDGLARALGVVAQVNADVKGAAADPDYALEQAVRAISAARRPAS